MPTFDLKGMKIAQYVNNNGTVTYSNAQTVGDSISCDMTFKKAEGRVYAEGTLAEYMTKMTGGTISIGVKYIPDSAQILMFGSRAGTRTISGTTINSIKIGAKDTPAYVGVAFYAPTMKDSVKKYFCTFVRKAMFGNPSRAYKTASDNITFNTDTTTGEFLADDSSTQEMVEYAYADTEAQAIAWVSAVLSGSSRTLNSIAVTTPPTKTTYSSGDTLDLSGMVVGALYSDASSEIVTSYTTTPASGATLDDETSVTISYTEGGVTKTTTQAITVS